MVSENVIWYEEQYELPGLPDGHMSFIIANFIPSSRTICFEVQIFTEDGDTPAKRTYHNKHVGIGLQNEEPTEDDLYGKFGYLIGRIKSSLTFDKFCQMPSKIENPEIIESFIQTIQ